MFSARKAAWIVLPLFAIPLFPVGARPQSQISAATSHRLTRLQQCSALEIGPTYREQMTSSLFGQWSDQNQICDRSFTPALSPEKQQRQLSEIKSNDVVATKAVAADIPSSPSASTSTGVKAAAIPLGSPFGVLKDVGLEGTSIMRARQVVFAILQSPNACSAWFRRSDPQVADTFLSLIIEVDEEGPSHVVKELNDRESWFEHGPYIARTRQGSGPGSVVTINGNGAFFRKRGGIFLVKWPSASPTETGTWRALHIGPYDGATLPGQVIVLLHELAHVVGAIPADDSAAYGFDRSPENTDVILHYCKGVAASSRKYSSLDPLRAAAD